MDTKLCHGCGEIKSFDCFGTDKSKKYGLQSKCKLCRKAYRQAKKDHIAEYNKVYKEANKDKIKAHEEAKREAKREAREAYLEANKEQIAEMKKARIAARKAAKKAYREANKEKIAEKDKAYREANKEKIAERRKAYREANKERIAKRDKAYREANREKIRLTNKAYRQTDKSKASSRAACAKRYATKLNLTPPDADLELIKQIFERCPEGYEVDHVVPLALGGLHHQGNLCYLPISENRSKQDKTLEQYGYERFYSNVIWPKLSKQNN